TTPLNDFVSAKFGDGLRTNAIGERIQFPQATAGVQNVELHRGTLEFYYQPNYNHDDNIKYTIAGTGTWPGAPAGRGSIHIGKHNNTNHNALFVIFFDANGARYEQNVAVSDYGWRAGEWHLFRLTWDFDAPVGVLNVHLYLDGRDLRLTGQVPRGPHPIPDERPDEAIYIGSRDVTGGIIANGIYDEVRIWNKVIPP
ncbi:MAG: LamG-like jellyroll fold domain-containing protein, partial [Gemmatimonadaceae bacterium]